MGRLLLVDGSNLLFQMFFGMPARIVNGDGRAIQGTLGFVGALLKMVRLVQPTHAAVFFDGEYVSVRGQLDEDYKANRTDYSQMAEEDTPFSQLPDIRAALDHLGIFHRETTVCETDDWMAAYALGGREGHELVIASQDSDYFQLIDRQVQVLRYRGDRTVVCDEEYIREKLGIHPGQYAGFKSLTGDSSDNIRGVEKVGPKTAAALMNEYGCLEDLLEQAETIRKPSIRESVIRSRERLERNYRLIRLTGGEPLPAPVEELRWSYGGQTTTEVLRAAGVR